MTFDVLDPQDWRHDVVARPLATLDVSLEQLEEKLGQALIYDETDFVPRYLAVVSLSDQDGQIGFERYEGAPKPEFVVTGIGTGWMTVSQLRMIFGFPAKAWGQLDPADSEPTPVERALEQWHRAKANQLKNKQEAGEALLAMRDAGLSYRGMAKVLGLSPSRVNQLVIAAGGQPDATRAPSHPTKVDARTVRSRGSAKASPKTAVAKSQNGRQRSTGK